MGVAHGGPGAAEAGMNGPEEIKAEYERQVERPRRKLEASGGRLPADRRLSRMSQEQRYRDSPDPRVRAYQAEVQAAWRRRDARMGRWQERRSRRE